MTAFTNQPQLWRAQLRRPRFTIYRVCETERTRFVRGLLNRYGAATIGAALIVGPFCYSLTWARPVMR